MTRVAWIALASTALACVEAPKPRSQLLVVIDTDAIVPGFVDRLDIEVYDTSGTTLLARRSQPVVNREDWPVSFALRSDVAGAEIAGRMHLLLYRSAQATFDRAKGVTRGQVATTLDRIVDVRFLPADPNDRARAHVLLHSDCLGVPSQLDRGVSCVDDPQGAVVPTSPLPLVAWDAPMEPSRVGTWPDGQPAPCTQPPRAETGTYDEELCIPGGAFYLGYGEPGKMAGCSGTCDGNVQRLVTLSPFLLDRYEASVARFRAAMRDPVRPFVPPTEPAPYNPNDTSSTGFGGRYCTWRGVDATPDPVADALPINCFPFETAQAFCKWAGGDLPSEAQWEYAATSAFREFKSIYPWGDTVARCEVAIIARFPFSASGCLRGGDNVSVWPVNAPYPAGARPAGCVGASCDRDETPGPGNRGIVGLAGNVVEWVRDLRVPYKAECWRNATRRDPACTQSPGVTEHMARGGGMVVDAAFTRPEFRTGGYPLLMSLGPPLGAVGFRCMRPGR